jgi:hypothetical protein
MTSEQVEVAAVPEMSEADIIWLKGVHEPLQPVARRHGKSLFQIVIQAGLISEALGRISAQGRGNRAIRQGIMVLMGSTDDLCKRALAGGGYTMAQFVECKGDIERVIALASAAHKPGDRISAGGIILDS